MPVLQRACPAWKVTLGLQAGDSQEYLSNKGDHCTEVLRMERGYFQYLIKRTKIPILQMMIHRSREYLKQKVSKQQSWINSKPSMSDNKVPTILCQHIMNSKVVQTNRKPAFVWRYHGTLPCLYYSPKGKSKWKEGLAAELYPWRVQWFFLGRGNGTTAPCVRTEGLF